MIGFRASMDSLQASKTMECMGVGKYLERSIGMGLMALPDKP